MKDILEVVVALFVLLIVMMFTSLIVVLANPFFWAGLALIAIFKMVS